MFHLTDTPEVCLIMIMVLGIIECILFVVSYVLTILYFVHMFQLNSYRCRAQYKWMSEHIGRVVPAVTGVVVCTVGLILAWADDITSYGINSYINALPAHVTGLITVIIVFFAIMLILYRPVKAKKKLVFTPRVMRLVATIIVLTIIMIALSLIRGERLVVLIILPLIYGIAPFTVTIAAECNRPVEYGVKVHYINDAKHILAQCPELKIVGITGSYGKTSVKYYLHDLLSAKYNVLMTPESYNTPMGVVKTIREQLTAAHQVFICEMGARHVGDIKEICDIVHPHDGIITSIGYQHLETFRSLDNIVNTKYELFDALPKEGLRFINGDNEIIRKYNRLDGVITYGLNEGNSYRASSLSVNEKGSTFTVTAPDGTTQEFFTSLIGKHNVLNILGAIAAAHTYGISLSDLRLPVRKLRGVPHRLQLIDRGSVTVIDDAYNSNPNGCRMALDTVALFDACKIIVTPGMVELGTREDEYNEEFGREAAAVCDYIVLVGEKQTQAIAKGVRSADFPEEALYITETLQDAVAYAYAINGSRMKEFTKKIILLENDLPDNY